MKDINLYFIILEYYYLINIGEDNKVIFDASDIIDDINWDIFNDLEYLIGYKESYF
jgi:hypothetical protein